MSEITINSAGQSVEGINKLFDEVIEAYHLSSDAKLSYLLHVAPPVISKQRNAILPIGPSMILSLHERGGLSIKHIRKMLEAK